jgi:cysteine-rich repeat protein
VNCTVTACGNGITTAAEACDDGDATGGDGCSASCLIEAGFSCLGTPSACSQTAELNCNNAADDDADGMMDCADTDCALGCDPLFGACAAGHSLLVFAGTGLPKPVGAAAAVSSIAVGGGGVVARGAVKLSITHVWDSDLDISIDPPGAPPIDLSSDNGDDGDNYTNTTFNSACATPITSGAPPFSGCFAPESSLGVLFGTPLQGTWTLTANDDYPSADHGSLDAWSVAVCAAPATCGNGVVNAGEACDDGNADNTDACLTTCQLAACGDGFLQAVAGEVCDDGNTATGDCCSPACQPAAGCGVESEPNNTCGQEDGPFVPSPNLSFIGSISPVGDQDFLAFTIPAVATVRIETFTGSMPGACDGGVDTVIQLRGPVCSTVIASDDDSGLNACSDINPAAYPGARQLAPGTYFVRVEDFNNDDPIGAYNVRVSITSLCANGVVEPFEGCDDGGSVSGDGCSATCVVEPNFACNGSPSVCVPACGSGTLESNEECDDGNTMSGDGCSSSCLVEADYQCTVEPPPPSVCSVAETNCGDGSDNDGDGVTDLADTDCDFGNAIAACGAGQALYVYNSVNVPVDVLDTQTSTSAIFATHGGTIARAAVRLSIDHTFDGDLDISLVSPAGTTRDLSSDNGSSGMDYTATIFDNACATAITAGMPPYTGCYTPEQPLTLLNGQNPDGVWLLNVYDDASGDTGAITNWSLALCVTP